MSLVTEVALAIITRLLALPDVMWNLLRHTDLLFLVGLPLSIGTVGFSARNLLLEDANTMELAKHFMNICVILLGLLFTVFLTFRRVDGNEIMAGVQVVMILSALLIITFPILIYSQYKYYSCVEHSSST